MPSFLRKILQKGIWPPGGYGLSLRLSGMTIGIGGILLAAVVAWAFFMGFWVGRGQNPEQTLEQMRAGLAPGKLAGAEGSENAGQVPGGSQSGQEQDNAIPASPGDSQQWQAKAAAPVADPLRQNPGKQDLQQGQTVASSHGAVQKPDDRGRKAVAASLPQPARPDQPGGKGQKPQVASDQKQASAKKDKQQAKKQEPARPDKPVYDYVYQVAASKSEADAKNLAQKLSGAGQKASIKKSGKVWLVLFSLRGTEDDAAKSKSSVQSALGKALRGKMLRLAKNEVGKNPGQAPSKGRK